jgi:hypothetical protein
MVANPVLVNGGMQFALESAHVGSFPAPPAAQEKLRKALNDKQGDWAPAKTGIYFTDIQVREGMAILTGTTTGR